MTDAKCDAIFKDKKARNRFFASVGALPCPTLKQIDDLKEMGPEKAFSTISYAAAQGSWE